MQRRKPKMDHPPVSAKNRNRVVQLCFSAADSAIRARITRPAKRKNEQCRRNHFTE
jgi:hypothetical protein